MTIKIENIETCFQSVFYRRVIFANTVLVADSQNKAVNSFLGIHKTIKVSENLWYKDGTLNTKPGGIFSIEEVEKCIQSMIGNK